MVTIALVLATIACIGTGVVSHNGSVVETWVVQQWDGDSILNFLGAITVGVLIPMLSLGFAVFAICSALGLL